MSNLPKIYGYCEAMCNWETIHRSEFEDKVGGEIKAVDSVYELPLLNAEYTIYRSGSSTTAWGITLKIKYLIAGIYSTFDISPDNIHTITVPSDSLYILPAVAVDGDYIKYVVTKAEAYHANNAIYFRIYLKYKTENTEWQEGSFAVRAGGSIGVSNVSYGGMVVSSGANKVLCGGEVSGELATIEQRLEALGFKEGTVYYDGEAVDSAVASIKKQGKYVLLSFITINQNITEITVPDEFKPKQQTNFTAINTSSGLSLGTTLSISTDGVITINSGQYQAINVGWEIK